MTPDTLIVLAIVAAAAFFVLRRFVRQTRAPKNSCGCSGSSDGCQGCKSAPGDLATYDSRKDAGGNGCGCGSGQKR
ncbi:MAG: FeoB-associated Cys-rich membrane protein [Desulfovibrio sp.]